MPPEVVAQGKCDFTEQCPPAVYSCVKDATRLGNPAKDLEIFLMKRARFNPRSQWLLAQEHFHELVQFTRAAVQYN